MRIAYHMNGSAVTDHALRQWIAAAKTDMAAALGTLITVGDPKHPYYFGTDILSDDRETQGGARYSRIIGTRRRATLEFNLCTPEVDALWQSWHSATLGGRIPFVWEEPLTLEKIAVTAAVRNITRRETYRRYQPISLELIEWL